MNLTTQTYYRATLFVAGVPSGGRIFPSKAEAERWGMAQAAKPAPRPSLRISYSVEAIS